MLRYEFDSTVMQRLASPVFDRIADTLLDALVSHADRHFAVTPPSCPVPRAAGPADAGRRRPAAAAAVPLSEAAPRNLPTPTTIPAAPDPAPLAPAAAAPAASPSPDPSTRSPE